MIECTIEDDGSGEGDINEEEHGLRMSGVVSMIDRWWGFSPLSFGRIT